MTVISKAASTNKKVSDDDNIERHKQCKLMLRSKSKFALPLKWGMLRASTVLYFIQAFTPWPILQVAADTSH